MIRLIQIASAFAGFALIVLSFFIDNDAGQHAAQLGMLCVSVSMLALALDQWRTWRSGD